MQVNLVAVLVAALTHNVIGFIWYSPLLFQKLWMQLDGITEFKMTAKDGLLSIVISLTTAYVLAIFVKMGEQTIMTGAKIGLLAGLGFIVTLLFGDVVFSKKPVKLFLLRAAYNLIALAVMGAILATL